MIKSSKISLKFSNTEKLNQLKDFYDEYHRVTLMFIDLIWDEPKLSSLLPKEITSKVVGQTWLSARAIQACGKQASGIVRGTKKKTEKRLFVYNQMVKSGEFKKARKLNIIITKNPITKPTPDQVNPQLDGRFIKLGLDNKTSFDGWLTIGSIGKKMKIELPFKRTAHLNNLITDGWKLNTSGARINQKNFSLTLEREDVAPQTEGKTLGIDIGIKSVYSASNGQQAHADKHGWNLGLIQKKMNRRKKGSSGYLKAQQHRKNHINWILNGLDLNGVSKVRLERIKHLRRGKKTSSFLSRWTYTEIFDKLKDKCALSGVQINYISPTYTSQRCSNCGWTRKRNRSGIQFKCDVCGFTANADLNASMNIALELPAISREKRLRHENVKGFYWNVLDKEPIVPFIQKA